MQRIENLNVSGQRVFLRADLDQVVTTSGVAAEKLTEILPSIELLLNKKATVILAGHDAPGVSFQSIATHLTDKIQGVVHFASIAELPARIEQSPGSLIVLENLCKQPGEAKNEKPFADSLQSCFDLYVSEAFGASVLPYASILRLPEKKPAAAGIALREKLTAIQEILGGKRKPLVMFIGGNGFQRKSEVLGKLLRLAQSTLVGGSVAYTFMKARLVDVGNSVVDSGEEVTAFQLQEKAELNRSEFLLPVDHIVSERFTRDSKSKSVKAIPDRWVGIDIGPKTVSNFEKAIKGAGTILWYGTTGAIELPEGVSGTKEMMKILSKSKADCTIIGEDTVHLARGAKLENATLIRHSSPALEILAGRTPEGLAILSKEG